jgi:hypothetical protein
MSAHGVDRGNGAGGTGSAPGPDTLGFNQAASGFRLGINAASNPAYVLLIQHDTSDADDQGLGNPVFIQRQVDRDESFLNPKALRVKTIVGAISSNQKEWAISAEIDSSATGGSSAGAALSGVANKLTGCLVGLFSGHFNMNDQVTYGAATSVTPSVGFEANICAIGVDHPTANSSVGNRLVEHVIAYNYPVGAAISAEIGCGILIDTEGGAGNGYFRNGIAIQEGASATNKITNAINIATTGAYGIRIRGANTTAALDISGGAAIGILLNATFTTAAMRLASGQKIAFEGTSAIAMKYDSGTSRLWMANGATEKVGFNLGVTPGIHLSGTQVIGPQGASVADATDAASTMARLNDLLARCRAHGLIAT